MRSKTSVLLLNVGTPDSPDTFKVRKYLSEFLNDKRIIDIPWFLRKLLVNFIIVPFRAPKSAKLYQKLWTGKGSPLLFHGISLQEKLQRKLGEAYIVEFATNYQHPNINEVAEKVLKQNVSRIIAFPLFPQYASSTTGSVIEKLLNLLSSKYNIPAITTIVQYYDHPLYLEAIVARVCQYDYTNYDHILMSFHGLPISQVSKSHNGKTCVHFNCTKEVSEQNQYCYHASCYATSRLLAGKLNLDKSWYTVCFQSRIAKNWLSPFTDEVITTLAKEGKKRLLVICPSFTADNLETTIEIGNEYKDLFLQNGGTELTLVESLNDSERWVDAIGEMIS
ncbi:MAG: ferrochelatase [Bacteroidales bacterium]|nr:ferrochelatase [Bacteroidales bacterium]